jgi:hypothetical protein
VPIDDVDCIERIGTLLRAIRRKPSNLAYCVMGSSRPEFGRHSPSDGDVTSRIYQK